MSGKHCFLSCLRLSGVSSLIIFSRLETLNNSRYSRCGLWCYCFVYFPLRSSQLKDYLGQVSVGGGRGTNWPQSFLVFSASAARCQEICFNTIIRVLLVKTTKKHLPTAQHFNEQQGELANSNLLMCYNLAISNLPTIICSFIIESWKQKGGSVFILLFLQIQLAH